MNTNNGIKHLLKVLLPNRNLMMVPLSLSLFAYDATEQVHAATLDQASPLISAQMTLTPYPLFNPEDDDCEDNDDCEIEECDEEEEDCEGRDDDEECDEDDEECEGRGDDEECDEDDEECKGHGDDEECDEDDEECEGRGDDEECDEDDEDCEGRGDDEECDEDDEDCEGRGDDEECDEDDEDCEGRGDDEECDEDDEECEGRGDDEECDEDDEECEGRGDDDECDEDDEECEGDGEQQAVSTGFVNPNPLPDNTIVEVAREDANRASRFLNQATLGANYPTVTQVADMGEANWLENQFEQPVGYIFPYTEHLLQQQEQLGEEQEPFGSPVKFHMHGWWTQIMTSPDLVRQRVAVALSEIFVISSNVETLGESPYAFTSYYDTLLKHSFGNYRDLLRDISLNPSMAIYLSHLNNEKANPETGTFPDENYAREVMQLFSIGLFELNPDGSRKKDANGQDIPTYGQDEIREFAKIFTGLAIVTEDEEGFGVGVCCNPQFYLHALDLRPLQMWDQFHSPGEKKLLNGTVVPAGQTGMEDIEAAIDNLFNHPNVGPFIGKQLIQRLVKSNPSPAYIARVTAAFNGDDNTPRGDMKAVLRAVLLDEEAREIASDNFSEGRLREPFLRLVRLARSFDATTPERTYAAEGYDVRSQIQQYVFYAPSVFNFFQPSYSPNGDVRDAELVAPEFQITNAVTIIEIKNLVQHWLMTGRFDDQIGQMAPETVDFSYELTLADNSDALLDHLDTVMTYGTLSNNTREAIRQVIENETNPIAKVKKAVYLMATSPDYAIAL